MRIDEDSAPVLLASGVALLLVGVVLLSAEGIGTYVGGPVAVLGGVALAAWRDRRRSE